ncbi:phosphatase PAP2 family protein [Sphingobium sp.]|uniref:phosphatase PAP2 family protein n=1 Tax=Sphingobium sp. TaxID=1912891 RepID=UPI0025D758B0|nr:phosphatase PAP2 family protein [Sphingobium sp.]
MMLGIDRALGYDWQHYVRFVAVRPWLRTLDGISYASILWQPALICFVLSLRNQERRLVVYQVATFVALVLAVAIFAIAPVTTAWVHGVVVMPEIQQLDLPVASGGWVHKLVALRAGQERMVAWGVDARIIGFPSFHCAAALLNGWALARERAIRPMAIALNAAMIAATPLLGGHYLVDLIGGSVLALASVVLANSVYPQMAGMHRKERVRPRRPWRNTGRPIAA